MKTHRTALALAAALVLAAHVGAQTPRARKLPRKPPRWEIVRPSNSGVPGELVRLVRHDSDGRVWVGARWPFWGEGGFGILDRTTRVWKTLANWQTPIPSEFVNDLEFASDGSAWMATDGGLVHYDGAEWRVWNASNSPMLLDRVGGIALDADGHVWMSNTDNQAGGDAVLEFDGVSGWRRFQVPEELPWPAPWTDLAGIFVDSRGHVWVANGVLAGAAEFDGQRWGLRMENRGVLASFVEDQLGNIWTFGNPVGGDYAFFRWNGETSTRYAFGSPTTIASDPDTGAIYVGNWYGTVVRTFDGGETIETYLTGLNQVFSIAPDPAGTDVWIGTRGAVGHFLGDGSWVRDYNSWNTGMPDYFVDYFATTRDGYFWVASGEAGLSRFDGKRWRNWGEHNAGAEPYPFAGNEPMGGAYLDSRGRTWFGGNGIARWDSATGGFSGFWNWQNNPGMGVTLFPFFAEDASGRVFAEDKYGAIFHFDEAAETWAKEPLNAYGSNVPGMQADSAGIVWVPDLFNIHRWDGQAWSTVVLPDPNFFADLGGTFAHAIGPDDVQWFGTGGGGIVRWDGVDFEVFGPSNSPMPSGYVTGVAVRADGLVAVAAALNPSSSGVSLIDGDPADPQSWTVHEYGSSPLTHYQLGRIGFDAEGALWISCRSEGVVIHRAARDPVPTPVSRPLPRPLQSPR